MGKLVDRLRENYEAQVRAGRPAPEAWAAVKEDVSLDRTRGMVGQTLDTRTLAVKTNDPRQSLRADQALVHAGIASTTYRNDKGVFRTYVEGADAERAKAVIAQAEAQYQASQQREQAKSGMGMGIGL